MQAQVVRWSALLGLWAACAPPAAAPLPDTTLRTKPLQVPQGGSEVPAPVDGAYCDVTVDGAGVLDLETEYLPNVVRCENGGANLEALKAQAIAARSVAYYAMETDGSICDSQGCQVYSCGGSADAIHHQAVQETSGMYLKYGNVLTYGFYVAGDPNVASPSCVGAVGGGPTEHYVTYNEGNAGTDVEQTDLGFVFAPTDNGYGQNRGCMSQWGARCLENDNGYDAVDILRFFFGDDIEIVQAQGACVVPVDPSGDSGTGGTSAVGSDGALDSTGGGLDETGGGDAGDTGGGSSAVDDDDGGAGGTAGSGADGPGQDDAAGGSGGGPGTALPDTFGADDDEGGCACTSAGPDSGQRPLRALWLSVIVGLALRRRRRPH